MSTYYFLVTHGSRDPRPHLAQKQLAQLLGQRLGQWGDQAPIVGAGTLELARMPLHQQLEEFGKFSHRQGCDRIDVIPLFLLPGIHLMEDIPAEVRKAQQRLGSRVQLEIQPYLGSHPALGKLFEQQKLRVETQLQKQLAWILLAHGSRRQQGNHPVITLAEKLGAIPAYWSGIPDLKTQVRQLVHNEQTAIGILPYFLFSGGITDAIVRLVEEIREEFPPVEFYLGEPLDISVDLADILVNLLTGSPVLPKSN